MQKFIEAGRTFYGIAMIAYEVQQIVYSDFRSVQIPAWQSGIALLPVWAYIAVFAFSGIALVTGAKTQASHSFIFENMDLA